MTSDHQEFVQKEFLFVFLHNTTVWVKKLNWLEFVKSYQQEIHQSFSLASCRRNFKSGGKV